MSSALIIRQLLMKGYVMIGYITANPTVSKPFTDCLLKFASLYQVPFCVISLEQLLAHFSGAPLIGQIWDNGSIIESSNIPLPSILDSETCFFQKKFDSYYTPGFLSWIQDNCNIIKQRSIPKQLLPSLLTSYNMAEYAIPTWSVASYDELIDLFHYSDYIFLKPISGRKGRGTFRVRKSSEHTIFIKDANREQVLSAQAFNDMLTEINISKLGNTFLAQPCLDFSLDDRHAVDFRLLRHIGKSGEWEEVATYARIGASSLVSNVSQGGFIADAKDTIQMIAGSKLTEIFDEIIHLGNVLPRLIQSKLQNDVFCLGLDIAIDRKTLCPYVLEANTYPGTRFHQYQLAEKRVQYYQYYFEKQS